MATNMIVIDNTVSDPSPHCVRCSEWSDYHGSVGDDDIRDGLLAGDLDPAFRILRERYGNSIYRVCYSILRQDDLADDAMQEAFTKMYRKRRRLAGATSIKAYAAQVAKNTALDMLRIAKRRRSLDREHHGDEPETAVSIESPNLEHAETAALQECLDEIDPPTRQALILFHRDEVPWQDVAATVGVPADTIRMRVTRVLKALKACLERKGIDP